MESKNCLKNLWEKIRHLRINSNKFKEMLISLKICLIKCSNSQLTRINNRTLLKVLKLLINSNVIIKNNTMIVPRLININPMKKWAKFRFSPKMICLNYKNKILGNKFKICKEKRRDWIIRFRIKALLYKNIKEITKD